MDIYEYLSSKSIIINDEKFRACNSTNKIDDQIQLIADTHKKLLGGKEIIIPRIQSVIGKELEGYKVEIKKCKRYINEIECTKNISEFEYYLASEARLIVKEAENTLGLLNSDIYFKIIKRSMRRYEICLGRVDEGNLKKDKNEIVYIRSNKYIAYNLLENDCYNYIKKLKKRRKNYNIEEIITEFVTKSSLDMDSIKYLNIISKYPTESMKFLSKYRSKELNYQDETLEEKLKEAKESDGIKLL